MNQASFHRIRGLSAIFLAGVVLMGLSAQAWAWEPTLPKGAQGPVSWYQNGKDGRYFVPVVNGSISKPTTGKVTTDANCMPDAQGLSHCFNNIRLSSGELITVQNTHKMSIHRCLRPGEYVKVQPNGSKTWAIVQTEPGR